MLKTYIKKNNEIRNDLASHIYDGHSLFIRCGTCNIIGTLDEIIENQNQ